MTHDTDSIADLVPAPARLRRADIPDHIVLGDRPLELRLTPAARRALAARHEPLDVEMELLFSCFVAKRMAFRDVPDPQVVARARLSGPVTVSYRVMLTRTCETASEPPRHETLPVECPQPYAPKWLALDYAAGQWRGEFGY
ncbi:MAG: hypothetical protein OEM83_02105 [Gammaproteobacteria bacterium]|nr:hypothetical protein [Gammaproteobacteria bacterium]